MLLTNWHTSSILKKSQGKEKWALSSAGRASALQAGGHRFEPYSAHHFFYLRYHASSVIFSSNGLIAQLVRALACHARGRGFEPLSGRHYI